MADNEGLVDRVQEMAPSGNGRSLASTLLSKEILIPAALSAGAALATRKAPEVARRVTKSIKEKGDQGAESLGRRGAEGAKKALGGNGGGLGSVATGVVKKAFGGGDGAGPGGKTRRLPIQRWTDVAVPLEEAYEQWTKFEEFPKFMHRVLSVEQKDDDKVSWDEKIWFSKRHWEAQITERRKNDRIAWKTTSGMSHAGVISFHRLDTRLTRVMVTIDFVPTGMIEKMASGLRFVKRAVQADLARFKAFVEMGRAKGLEYKSTAEHEEKDEERQRGDSGNGSRAQSEQGGGEREESDEEREAARRERESHREERRQTVTA